MHSLCSDVVQPTLLNDQTQVWAPSWLLFPHLKEHKGLQVWCPCQMCGQICSHCLRPIDDHSSRGLEPVYSRGSKTETVLWLKDRCHRIEAWWSHPNQGRCFSREEEDQGQMGEQASWGSTSDCKRHPLIWSERPTWKLMCPMSQLAAPHSIRNQYSLVCGHLPNMGWIYQSNPSQTYSWGEWQQDNATRRWWPDEHPASG